MKKTIFSPNQPVCAEIDLAALANNFRVIKKRLPKGVKILAPVKANAYGHGIVESARILTREGVDWFGVARIEEAVCLRKAGVKTPVLILGSLLTPEEIRAACDLRAAVTVVDYKSACRIQRVLGSRRIDAHVKVDTGMGRLGIWHEQAVPEIERICRLKSLIPQGIFTHFSCADSDPEITGKQAAHFQSVLNKLRELRIEFPLIHTANSAALKRKQALFNMVRPGIILYGMTPWDRPAPDNRLRPVLSLKSRIIQLKPFGPGRGVSYGQTHITSQSTLIGVVPVGYADGYPRSLSNRARVLVRGRFAPVIGRICMDLLMIDVGHVPLVKPGDAVVLIGRQGRQQLRTEELAGLAGTIPYEITTGVSARVPRVFKSG